MANPMPPSDRTEKTTVTGIATDTVSLSGVPSYGATPAILKKQYILHYICNNG